MPSDLQDLDFAGIADLERRVAEAKARMLGARDERYATALADLASTIVAENPIIETPTSNYAGHRVDFSITLDGREYLAHIDLRDVKRSAERKAERAAAETKADTPAEEPAPAKA